jgi:hypothetical protein
VDIEDIKGKTGLKSAIAELDNRQVVPEQVQAPEQTTFLPENPVSEGLRRAGVRTGPGRPPGAKNKNTEIWREYWLSKYAHPVEGLLASGSCSLQQFAEVFGFKWENLTFNQRTELFKLQIGAMKEAAPYVAQKMPQEVDLGGNSGLIQLVINSGLAGAAGVQDAGPVAFKVLNTPDEENQMVTDADFAEEPQSRHNAKNQGKDNP